MDRYSHPGVDRIFPCFYLLQDSCIHVKKIIVYIYTYNSTSIYSFIYSIYFVIVHPIYNPDLQYQHMPRTLRTLRTLCHIPVAAINSLVMAGAVLTNVAVSRSFSWNARSGCCVEKCDHLRWIWHGFLYINMLPKKKNMWYNHVKIIDEWDRMISKMSSICEYG